MKKFLSLLLTAALLLCCCACGRETVGSFRVLETVGSKQYGVICRKDDRLAPAVNAAMNVLAANGTLSAISSHWLGSDRISLEGDADALAELAPEMSDRVLIIGVEAESRPMAFLESGEHAGISVEIGKALGALLNCAVEFHPISAAEVGAQLSSGNVDCAIGFDSALVNTENYDIGVVFMNSDILLAVRSGSDVKKIKDLKGERVGLVEDAGVQRAVKSHEKLTKYASGATVYLSLDRCLSALDQNWCAAIALDELQLAFIPQA